MANGVNWDSLLDAVETTRSKYPLVPDYDILLADKRWHFLNDIMSPERRMITSGGKDLKHIIAKKETGAASMVLPWETTDINQEEVAITIVQEWRRAQTFWNIEDTEESFDQSPESLVELIDIRRTGALHSAAKRLEDQFWTSPPTTGDKRDLHGIPFFLPEITGAQITAAGGNNKVAGDHQAGNPYDAAGNQFSSYLGQDRGEAGNERLKTYCDTWEGVDGFRTARDIRALDQAFLDTFFEAPMGFELGQTAEYNWRLYTDRNNRLNMIEQSRNQDMQLGPDILQHHGTTFVNNTPVRYAPQLNDYTNLDGTTGHPLFAINLREIKCLIRSGRNMKESKPFSDKEQHNVVTYFIDWMLTIMGYNTQTMGFNITYRAAA